MSTQPHSPWPTDPNKVYRVVQWATGRIGACSLRELIRSPQMKLVGVYVHSAAKDGRDAGELCGLPPVGVTATRNIDKIIALKPDCVVAMQEGAMSTTFVASSKRASTSRPRASTISNRTAWIRKCGDAWKQLVSRAAPPFTRLAPAQASAPKHYRWC